MRGGQLMENIIELKDSELIVEIINKSFLTVALHFGFTKENAPFFPAFINSSVIENNFNNGLKMYGYIVNGEAVGCAGYSYYKDQIYFIQRLATLPDYRHLGVGKKLMEFVENKIIELGGKIAEVHVVDKNILLIEWYKKLNYKEIRTDEIKATPYNSFVMNKALK
jgi:ribosomal protein S18 acetylase RimI-like enzyme